jgi:3-deoxy-D-manno-octulosonic-acid transferase
VGYTLPVVPLPLLLYRAGILAALPVAAPWLLLTARLRGKSRPSVASRLWWHPPSLPRQGVWIHAVSVGEVGVARPLLQELRQRFPHLPLVLSATTATGLATAAGAQLADAVVPLPLDLPGPVRRSLDAARPRAVVLVETELWPELLHACGQRNLPVVLANARISDRSFAGYRRCRRLLAPLLRPLTLALAQSEEDARRLVAIGVSEEKVRVAGNIKFDATPPREHPAVAKAIREAALARPIVVAGSTMPGEEELVLSAVQQLPHTPPPFLLLAPRHPERAERVAELVAQRGLRCRLRSRLAQEEGEVDVVVLDTVGELAALYSVGCLAFVGGSLVPTGGHNPIEPARYGIPIVSGVHVRNFAAVYREFVAAGAARLVRSAEELGQVLHRWLADQEEAAAVGQRAASLLRRHAGATARVVDALQPLLQ